MGPTILAFSIQIGRHVRRDSGNIVRGRQADKPDRLASSPRMLPCRKRRPRGRRAVGVAGVVVGMTTVFTRAPDPQSEMKERSSLAGIHIYISQ